MNRSVLCCICLSECFYGREPKFCQPQNCAFGDIDFKLIIKKQKTRKEPLIVSPLSCLEIQREGTFA